MRNKGAFQISFPWLFAIIVGITILFLTIYGITKGVKTQESFQDVKTSKEIGILMNPLETGFEEAKSSEISFPVNTRIFASCEDFGIFGEQKIRVSQTSLGKWSQTNLESSFKNKYIFSKEIVEGKKMNVFSKAFDFPFKVADLVYLISKQDTYCFVDAPEDIQDEIENLNQDNLVLDNCPENSIKVCFSTGNNCNIAVKYEQGSIEKPQERVYFETDALMYAGIFSDKQTYECQLKRLMKRLSNLIDLYKIKSDTGYCDSGLKGQLESMKGLADSLDSSADLFPLKNLADKANIQNKGNYDCRLW